MFCLYCGTHLPEEAVFCNKCGKRQPPPAAQNNSVLLGSMLPKAPMGSEQSPAGNVPMVQGTPTTVHISPGQSFAHSAANAVPSALPPSLPPQAASEALQAPSPSPEHQTFPSSDLQTLHRVTSRGLKPTGYLSRRTVVLGLTAAATAIVAGGLTLSVRSGALKLPVISNDTSGSHVPVPASFNVAMFGFDPQHTRFNPYEHILNPKNVARLTLYWAADTGSIISSSPAVVDRVVYVGSWDYKLYALDAKTGAVLWTYATENAIASSPAVVNGIVYFGSGDHKLYALSAKTGAVLWTYDSGSPIQPSPTVANGIVYICSNYSPYALDAKTGTILWSYDTGDAAFSPAVANGVVYVGSNKLYALNAKTGTALWSYDTRDDIVSSPAVANGVVYVGSEDGKFYAFHLPPGTA